MTEELDRSCQTRSWKSARNIKQKWRRFSPHNSNQKLWKNPQIDTWRRFKHITNRRETFSLRLQDEELPDDHGRQPSLPGWCSTWAETLPLLCNRSPPCQHQTLQHSNIPTLTSEEKVLFCLTSDDRCVCQHAVPVKEIMKGEINGRIPLTEWRGNSASFELCWSLNNLGMRPWNWIPGIQTGIKALKYHPEGSTTPQRPHPSSLPYHGASDVCPTPSGMSTSKKGVFQESGVKPSLENPPALPRWPAEAANQFNHTVA